MTIVSSDAMEINEKGPQNSTKYGVKQVIIQLIYFLKRKKTIKQGLSCKHEAPVIIVILYA